MKAQSQNSNSVIVCDCNTNFLTASSSLGFEKMEPCMKELRIMLLLPGLQQQLYNTCKEQGTLKVHSEMLCGFALLHVKRLW